MSIPRKFAQTWYFNLSNVLLSSQQIYAHPWKVVKIHISLEVCDPNAPYKHTLPDIADVTNWYSVGYIKPITVVCYYISSLEINNKRIRQ